MPNIRSKLEDHRFFISIFHFWLGHNPKPPQQKVGPAHLASLSLSFDLPSFSLSTPHRVFLDLSLSLSCCLSLCSIGFSLTRPHYRIYSVLSLKDSVSLEIQTSQVTEGTWLAQESKSNTFLFLEKSYLFFLLLSPSVPLALAAFSTCGVWVSSDGCRAEWFGEQSWTIWARWGVQTRCQIDFIVGIFNLINEALWVCKCFEIF